MRELIDQILKLSAAAVAQAKNLNSKRSRGLNTAHNALRAKRKVVNLEADLQPITHSIIGIEMGLNETAFKTEIEDTAFVKIPAQDAKVDRAGAGITRSSASFWR